MLSISCILLGEIHLWKTKDLIEYALPFASNAQAKNNTGGRSTILQALPELKKQMQSAKLSAALVRQEYEVSAENSSFSSCTLYGISGDWLEQHGEKWISGRAFTAEEQAEGSTVALVNQALARQLWQEETATNDRSIIINGREYQVVGILKDSFSCSRELYIPLKTSSESEWLWDVQILSAENVRMNIFKDTAEEHLPGGTLYNLQRERIKTGLALRYTCVAFLILALKYCFAWICFQNGHSKQRWKKKQELCYPDRMIAPSLLFVFQALLLWALWGMAAMLTLRLAVYPAYVFPEFVPSIPIHMSEYVIQFQNALRNTVRFVTASTKSVEDIHACGHLLTGGTFGLLLSMALNRIGRKMKFD